MGFRASYFTNFYSSHVHRSNKCHESLQVESRSSYVTDWRSKNSKKLGHVAIGLAPIQWIILFETYSFYARYCIFYYTRHA